jgi:thiol-disulfide isomerase/thioredoxin
MARDITKVMIKIEDDLQWDSIVEQSDTKLVVIDCHQEWCGYCEAIHPSLNRVLLDYDNIEERFIYAVASIGKVGSRIQASFPSDLNINLEKNGCLPLFAVFRVCYYVLLFLNLYLILFFLSQHKTCIFVVVGVDSPTLLQQISLNMPEKPVKE